MKTIFSRLMTILAGFIVVGCQTVDQVMPTTTGTIAPKQIKTPTSTWVPPIRTAIEPAPTQVRTNTPISIEWTATATHTPAPPSETPVAESTDVEELLECYQVPDPVLYDNTSQDIHLSGIFVLCRQWPLFLPQITFDLDNGQASNIENLESDIEFSISYARALNLIYYNLSSINEAQIFESEKKEPSIEDCLSIVVDDNLIIEANTGATACLITNEGRLAYIRVERIDPYKWGSIEVSFVTWNKIVRP